MLKIDKKYLPSRNFVIALSASITIILITLLVINSKSNTTNYINGGSTLGTNASSSVMNIDTDKDGLVNWKEVLYGTDPKVADTDKDGTSDLDEITQNRDPLKANTASKDQEPNDKIDQAIIEENQKAIEEYNKLSDQEKFSRNLLSNIIASQPTSGKMDEKTVSALVEQSLSEMPYKTYYGKTKTADLTLQKTTEADMVKNLTEYGKNFFTEMNKLKSVLFTDLPLMESYMTLGDAASKEGLSKVADKYQVIVNNLIKMPVPVAIGYYDINYHLTIINDLEKIIAIDKDIAGTSKNPFDTLSGIAAYNNTVEDIVSTLTTINGILNTGN